MGHGCLTKLKGFICMHVNGFHMYSTKRRMISIMENLACMSHGSQPYRKAYNTGSVYLNSQRTFVQKRRNICHWAYMKRDM